MLHLSFFPVANDIRFAKERIVSVPLDGGSHQFKVELEYDKLWEQPIFRIELVALAPAGEKISVFCTGPFVGTVTINGVNRTLNLHDSHIDNWQEASFSDILPNTTLTLPPRSHANVNVSVRFPNGETSSVAFEAEMPPEELWPRSTVIAQWDKTAGNSYAIKRKELRRQLLSEQNTLALYVDLKERAVFDIPRQTIQNANANAAWAVIEKAWSAMGGREKLSTAKGVRMRSAGGILWRQFAGTNVLG